MRRRILIVSFLAALHLVSFSLQWAYAQPPDLLRSYKFLPPFSTLHQTGGIAGFDLRLPIHGTYDFITGFRGNEFPVPTLEPYAQFANVDATVDHPHYEKPLNIDEVLNLSGLEGKPIHHGPHDLTVYRFTGDDGSGEFAAKVKIHVATLGRWMFMRGGTIPPCCDFFQYDIKAISRQIPFGDFDDDGDVTASDLVQWHTGKNMVGDALGGRDFLAWQRTYGETAPSISEFDAMLDVALAASSSASFGTVPEPSTLLLLASFALGWDGKRITN